MTTTETPAKLWTSDDLFALRPSKKADRCYSAANSGRAK